MAYGIPVPPAVDAALDRGDAGGAQPGDDLSDASVDDQAVGQPHFGVAVRRPLRLWRSLPSQADLSAFLDVGGLGPADPALDLVGAWHLLDAQRRAVLRDQLGCGDLEWERGKAWAFQQSMGLVWYYKTSNPTMSRLGRRTLERITADKGSS